MFYSKRLFVASSVGFLCGISCFVVGKYVLGLPLEWSNLGFILLNRTIMGIVIGISNLKIDWIKHGALIGTIVGCQTASKNDPLSASNFDPPKVKKNITFYPLISNFHYRFLLWHNGV